MNMRGILSKLICAIAAVSFIYASATAQTTSTQTGSDGNWATAANWTNGVPGTGWTANVNKSLTLNTNISVSGGGRYNINSPVTDIAGGTAYTLSLTGSGSNGILDVFANTVFEGTANINSKGELIVEPGCTLTVGAATFANGSIVNVKAGGTLIINGDLTNNNNSDEITINGSLIVNGNFAGGNGSAILGAGTMSTTGTMTTSGSGTIFGQPGSCNSGPCSSATLCGTNTITPAASTICSGTSPGLITGSTMTGYSFKWQSATNAAGPWTDLTTTSTTNKNYTPGSLTANTYYRRYASNGSCTSYSTPTLITVHTTPAITGQPSSQTRCVGGTVTFTVTATGSSLTYQWKKNGSNISGATSSSYSIATIAAGDAASYTVAVSNTGCGSVTSSAATLTVYTAPAIQTPPSSQSVCAGSSVTFSVVATGTGLTYQWRKGGSNISGATSTSYTISSPVTGDAGSYDVVVSNAGCTSATSSAATLTINSAPSISVQPASQSVCLGAPVTFTVTASGTSLSYQWKKNGANVGTNSSSYTISSTVAGDAADYSVVISGTCSPAATSSNATLTINSASSWSGAVSTNWSTAGNWSCGIVPTNVLDVTIPAGLTNYPVVPASTTANVKSITIANGGSLTLTNSTSTLQVYGSWSNSGSFSANSGTVVFAGSSAQTISGAVTTNFHHITVTNTGAAVSLGHDENLSGTLTLNANTTFTATGFELVLTSNASSTGRIGAVPASATYNGNIRMQRYIPAIGDRLWYTLAAPVNGGTVAQWQTAAPTSGFYVTGPFTGASAPGNGINPAGVSAYSWIASTGSWSRYPTSSNTEAVVPGSAYRVFVRDGNATYNGGATTSKTFSVAGTPVIGNHTYTLNYAPVGGNPVGGWNLIGNPYPSDISTNLSGTGWINATNLDGFATYTWDSDGKSYVSCNGGIGTCVVPSSQGFWVKVLPGGGSITATESVKTTSSLAIYKVAYGLPNYIPVKLINGTTSENDIVYIRFEKDATSGFDNQYDAYKLSVSSSGVVNNTVSLYSSQNGINYSIQANPMPVENDTIPLIFSAPAGSHSLDFSDDSHLTEEFTYLLIDKFTNATVNLRKTPVYSFNITSDAASYQNRFFVVFSYKENNTTVDANPNPDVAPVNAPEESSEINVYPNPVSPSTEAIQVTLPENLTGTIEINVIDAQGILVHSEKRASAASFTLSLDESLKGGMYMLVIQSEGKQFRKKIIAR